MRGRHYCWVFLLLTFSGFASATDYYWISGADETHRPDPLAVCKAVPAGYGGYNWSNFRVTRVTDPLFKCFATRTTLSGSASWDNIEITSYAPNRYGSACPVGGTYNSETGVCVFPPPNVGENCGTGTVNGLTYPKIIDSSGNCTLLLNADLPAACKSLAGETKTPRVFVKFTGDGTPVVPKIDVMGCETSQIVDASCKLPAARTSGGISLAPAGSYCNVAVTFTGNVTPGTSGSGGFPAGSPDTGTEGICAEGQDCSAPEQPKLDEKQPCTYVYDAEGRKSCSSLNFTADPGTMNCGSVQGGPYGCTPKVPTSNGIQIGTTITETNNADGTKTETKTDVAKVTTCAGYNSCKTTNTTNKTVVIKDGNGNTVSSNGTCTGDQCATAGNPDGNGDGLGDCTGPDCAKEDVAVGAQDWFTPGDDSYGSVMTSFSDGIKATPVVSSMNGFLAVNPSGSCPVYNIDVWVFKARLDQWCSDSIPWELIKGIIVGCAAFLAFRIAFL